MSSRVLVLVLYCVGSLCFLAGSLLSLWLGASAVRFAYADPPYRSREPRVAELATANNVVRSGRLTHRRQGRR